MNKETLSQFALKQVCPVIITEEVEEEIATLLMSGEDIPDDLLMEVMNA